MEGEELAEINADNESPFAFDARRAVEDFAFADWLK